MHLTIESEQETDSRWLAEVPELPGVLAYGATRDEALAKAQVLALRVLQALFQIGWRVKRQSGSREDIGPRMVARIAKRTGLRPVDLQD